MPNQDRLVEVIHARRPVLDALALCDVDHATLNRLTSFIESWTNLADLQHLQTLRGQSLVDQLHKLFRKQSKT